MSLVFKVKRQQVSRIIAILRPYVHVVSWYGVGRGADKYMFIIIYHLVFHFHRSALIYAWDLVITYMTLFKSVEGSSNFISTAVLVELFTQCTVLFALDFIMGKLTIWIMDPMQFLWLSQRSRCDQIRNNRIQMSKITITIMILYYYFIISLV